MTRRASQSALVRRDSLVIVYDPALRETCPNVEDKLDARDFNDSSSDFVKTYCGSLKIL